MDKRINFDALRQKRIILKVILRPWGDKTPVEYEASRKSYYLLPKGEDAEHIKA